MSILPFLPDPELKQHAPQLLRRIEKMADQADGNAFASMLKGLPEELARGVFEDCRATEGTIWMVLRDEPFLVPIFNTGPNAPLLLRSARVPIERGMIGVVFSNGIGLAEAKVHANARHDATINRLTGELTCSMVAVRFGCAGRPRGVISCVKLKPDAPDAQDPPPFDLKALQRMEALASTIGSLLDLKFVNLAMGTHDS